MKDQLTLWHVGSLQKQVELVAQKQPSSYPKSPVSCSGFAQAGTALALLWELQLCRLQVGAELEVRAPQSSAAAKMGKVPPQQGVQGQGPIKLQLEVLHHLQVFASGGKE